VWSWIPSCVLCAISCAPCLLSCSSPVCQPPVTFETGSPHPPLFSGGPSPHPNRVQFSPGNGFLVFFLAPPPPPPPVGHGFLIHEVSISHTMIHHSRWDSSGRVISSSQRSLPDIIQHSRQTHSQDPGGIRAHNLSRVATLDRAATGTGPCETVPIKNLHVNDLEFCPSSLITSPLSLNTFLYNVLFKPFLLV